MKKKITYVAAMLSSLFYFNSQNAQSQEIVWANSNIFYQNGKLMIDDDPVRWRADEMYFKYGSVIGTMGWNPSYMSSGDEDVNDIYHPDVVFFNPTPIDRFYNWKQIPYTQVPDKIEHTLKSIKEGRGDPCRLVGLSRDEIMKGKIDNYTWRLPTYAEFKQLIIDAGGKWDKLYVVSAKDFYVEDPEGIVLKNIFFRLTGERVSYNGRMMAKTKGHLWTTDNPGGHFENGEPYFYIWVWTGGKTSSIHVNRNLANNGLPVRCVRRKQF